MNTRPVDPIPPTRATPPPPPTAGAPADPAQRVLTEIAQLRVKATGRDQLLLRVGIGLMVAGPLLTIVGYLQSSQTSSAFIQNDAIVISLIGLTLALVGTALFLRYSLGEFLRFWMARLLAEQGQLDAAAPAGPARGPAPANGRGAAPAAGPQTAPPPPSRPAGADHRPEHRP